MEVPKIPHARNRVLITCLVMLFALTSQPVQVASVGQEGPALTVSAASDLRLAFDEVGARFTEHTGIAVDFNFGSTGQLAEQIRNGAPVDVFAAANSSYIEELSALGLTIPETETLYARGRIVIWTRTDHEPAVNRLEDLLREDVSLVAIANPDHAPYGVAAREALEQTGIWEEIQDKLILGENVSDTLRYAQTGDVDVAIVALSLAIPSDGTWTLIDEALHQPLDQTLAVIAGTEHEREATAFAAFVNSPEGRSIMRSYGFVLPGESLDLDAVASPLPSASPET